MKILKLRVGRKVLRIKDCKHSSGRGLMFDDLKNKDGALIYANNIWMLFCKKLLDLFFLDEDFRVVDVRRAIPLAIFDSRTWKIHANEKAKYCLEIAAGRAHFKKGQKIKFS
jgi:uncharacterized membrane protein (UPF0127 family)